VSSPARKPASRATPAKAACVVAAVPADSCAPPLRLPASGARPNLLHLRVIDRVFRSRLYPGILQWIGLLVFGFVLVETLGGTNDIHDNAGAAIVWILWWPLLPLSYFVVARLWCAICPFPVVGEFLQKFIGRGLPVPAFLRKYGIWIIDLWFIGITWADHIWGIVESPRGTGYLLLMILAAAVTLSLVFERRTFCRHACFLGGLSGNYSMASPVSLRSNLPNCRATCHEVWCANGSPRAAACPMFETPRTMDSNRECNLCGNCVKSCPHGSIRVELRKPTSEFWNIQKPRVEVSFLAIVLVGVVIIQNLTMLGVWNRVLAFVSRVTGSDYYPLNFSLVFIVAMALPIGALFLASALSKGKGETTMQNFARYGYVLIALDLAGHMAHNLFHLLGEGLAVPRTIAELFGATWTRTGDSIINTPTIQVLQYMMLAAGVAGSAYAVYRIAVRNGKRGAVRAMWPHLMLLALLVAINVYMFTQPMSHRA
jgi:ferredoxin